MSAEVIVTSVTELQALAARVAQQLQGGELLLLYGELGAGKTTFVQGLAKALGIADPVTSPTFTIVGEYPVTSHPTIRELKHIDLYRLEPDTVATDPLVQDVLMQSAAPGRVTVVEWADRLQGLTVPSHFELRFAHGQEPSTRKVAVDPKLHV